METLAVLITCHNRKNDTLKCLERIYNQKIDDVIVISVYLTEDNCTDGTTEAVNKKYPQVNILHGDGSLYWNRGMHLAMSTAIKKKYNYYLWLNDDTFLQNTAIQNMINWQNKNNYSRGDILVGAIIDPTTNNTSYSGGVRVSNAHLFKYRRLHPNGNLQALHSMEGNCVLISSRAVDSIGIIDPYFKHSIGDTDYALRAIKCGITILLTPNYVGECIKNLKVGLYADKSFNRIRRLARINHPKSFPIKDWVYFYKKHGGTFWPYYLIRRTINVLIYIMR